MLTGCSGISEHKHYEIVPMKSLVKATVHDWVEDLTEPTFGVLRPPLYAFEYNDEFYIFYPILIEEKNISFGPAFLDDSEEDKKKNILFIRHYKQGSSGSFHPQRVSVILDGQKITVKEFGREETKETGVLYSYNLNNILKGQEAFQASVELIDGNTISIDFAKRKDLWVAPIFSFNEPPKKPKVLIQ
jgi:hypothetical protein